MDAKVSPPTTVAQGVVYELRGLGRGAGKVWGVYQDRANAEYYQAHLAEVRGVKVRVVKSVGVWW